MRKLLAGTLVFFIAAGFVVAGAKAATITVNSLAETVADDGVCTLREAVAAANTDMASGAMPGECDAGMGPDVIEFGAPLTGVITLGSALTITSSLEIDGPADRSIAIGGFLVTIDDSSMATVQDVILRRLTISTLVAVAENVAIHACTFTGLVGAPSAIAVGGDGKLLLSNSTISGNTFLPTGGAVGGSGVVAVVHSTIAANTGAGLLGPGFPIVINSVVADHTDADCLATPSVNVGNFFGDTSCDGTADGDPMLAGLADNGGPALTQGLMTGSPLRDTADDAGCLAADQRGGARALDGDGDMIEKCDIGAVEVIDDMTVPVELQSFTID